LINVNWLTVLVHGQLALLLSDLYYFSVARQNIMVSKAHHFSYFMVAEKQERGGERERERELGKIYLPKAHAQ
jgi:hypothetical protein